MSSDQWGAAVGVWRSPAIDAVPAGILLVRCVSRKRDGAVKTPPEKAAEIPRSQA
jgi:hypothetical protein